MTFKTKLLGVVLCFATLQTAIASPVPTEMQEALEALRHAHAVANKELAQLWVASLAAGTQDTDEIRVKERELSRLEEAIAEAELQVRGGRR